MKKKYLLFVALIVILGSSITGCYVDRGYYHPHHHYHHHDYGHYY